MARLFASPAAQQRQSVRMGITDIVDNNDWAVTALVLGIRSSGKDSPTNIIVLDHTTSIRIIGWEVPAANSTLKVGECYVIEGKGSESTPQNSFQYTWVKNAKQLNYEKHIKKITKAKTVPVDIQRYAFTAIPALASTQTSSIAVFGYVYEEKETQFHSNNFKTKEMLLADQDGKIVSVILRHDAVEAFVTSWNGGQQAVHILGVELERNSYGRKAPDHVCVRMRTYGDSIIKFDPDICARTELDTWMAEDNARMQKEQTAKANEEELGQQEGDEPFALYMAEKEAEAEKMAEEARAETAAGEEDQEMADAQLREWIKEQPITDYSGDDSDYLPKAEAQSPHAAEKC